MSGDGLQDIVLLHEGRATTGRRSATAAFGSASR